MNTNKLFILSILLPVLCFGQIPMSEDHQVEPVSRTSFFLESGVGFSVFTGEGHFAQGYDAKPVGWHIMTQFTMDDTWLFGFFYDDNYLRVNDRELTGAYDNSRIFHYQGLLGYRWLETNTFSLESSVGVGLTRVKNTVLEQDTRFLDKGWGLGAYGRAAWAFSDHLALYAGLNVNWDQFSTDVAPGLSGVFDDSFRIMPLIGLRLMGKKPEESR